MKPDRLTLRLGLQRLGRFLVWNVQMRQRGFRAGALGMKLCG